MVVAGLLVHLAHVFDLFVCTLGHLLAFEKVEDVAILGLGLFLEVAQQLALYIHFYHFQDSHYLSNIGAVASRIVQQLLVVLGTIFCNLLMTVVISSNSHSALYDLSHIFFRHLSDELILEVLQNGGLEAAEMVKEGAVVANGKDPDIPMGLYELEFLVDLLNLLLLRLVARYQVLL